MIVWRDGEITPSETAVSADDRGFLVGDAVFETMLVEGGQPAFLKPHLARLTLACTTLKMAIAPDEQTIRRAILDLSERTPMIGRAACRITVSRVGGPRGLAPGDGARARMIVALTPVSPPQASTNVILSKHIRLAAAMTNGFKCAGAYAQNLLARLEAMETGAGEAIMLNEFGRVACASSANVFLLTDQGLVTPPLREGAMPGVVRSVVLEEAQRLGLTAREAEIEPAALASVRLLLTNSIIGVAVGALGAGGAGAGDNAARSIIDAYQRRLSAAFVARPQGASA